MENGNAVPIPQQVGPGGSNAQIFQTENQVQAIANGQRVPRTISFSMG